MNEFAIKLKGLRELRGWSHIIYMSTPISKKVKKFFAIKNEPPGITRKRLYIREDK